MIDFLKENKLKLFPDWKETSYIISITLVLISLFLPVKLNSLAIGILGISWLLNNPIAKFKNLKTNWVALGFISLYILHGIGLLYSTNLDYGSKEMEYKLSMFLIPMIIATGPKFNKCHIRLFLIVFYNAVLVCIAAAMILAIIKIGGATGDTSFLQYFTYRNFSIPVGFDPIYLALFIVFASFALVYDKVLDQDLKFRKLNMPYFLFAVLLLFVALIFLSSRMETMVFVFSFICLAMFYGWRKKSWKLPIYVVFILPVLTISLIFINPENKARYSEMVDLEADYKENKWGGRSIRIEKWKNAIECWSQSPIIGVGSGDTIDELVKVYNKNDFGIAAEYRFNPHNQYLQTAVALGIIGLGILISIFLILFVKGWAKKDWLLMILVVIITASMLTESMMERQKGLVFIVLMSSLLYQRNALLNNSEVIDPEH